MARKDASRLGPKPSSRLASRRGMAIMSTQITVNQGVGSPSVTFSPWFIGNLAYHSPWDIRFMSSLISCFRLAIFTDRARYLLAITRMGPRSIVDTGLRASVMILMPRSSDDRVGKPGRRPCCIGTSDSGPIDGGMTGEGSMVPRWPRYRGIGLDREDSQPGCRGASMVMAAICQ